MPSFVRKDPWYPKLTPFCTPKMLHLHQYFTTRFVCILSTSTCNMFEYEFEEDRSQGLLAPHKIVGDLAAFASAIWINGSPFVLQSDNKQFMLNYDWQFHAQLNFEIHGPSRPSRAPVQCTGCTLLSWGLQDTNILWFWLYFKLWYAYV